MELEEQDIVLLEAYLAGQLAAEEARACAARLATEPALEATLALLRDLRPAAAMTGRASMRQDMAAAKAAAIAAGMNAYAPTINAPRPRRSFLIRLLKFLLLLILLLVAAYLIWNYFLRGDWPYQYLESENGHLGIHKPTMA